MRYLDEHQELLRFGARLGDKEFGRRDSGWRGREWLRGHVETPRSVLVGELGGNLQVSGELGEEREGAPVVLAHPCVSWTPGRLDRSWQDAAVCFRASAPRGAPPEISSA